MRRLRDASALFGQLTIASGETRNLIRFASAAAVLSWVSSQIEKNAPPVRSGDRYADGAESSISWKASIRDCCKGLNPYLCSNFDKTKTKIMSISTHVVKTYSRKGDEEN